MTRPVGDPQLFDGHGRRKYLQRAETQRLLVAASKADRQTRLFCHLLFYTGCRISEALAVRPDRLDHPACHVIFQTLKRRRPVFRAVPIPAALSAGLAALARGKPLDQPLFPFCRQTAWRKVKTLMAQARISGPQATPKGFRHAFGVLGVQCSIPESALARLMGHATTKSTQIYTFVTGDEERALVRRMW